MKCSRNRPSPRGFLPLDKNHLQTAHHADDFDEHDGPPSNVVHVEMAVDLWVMSPRLGVPVAKVGRSQSYRSHQVLLPPAGGVGVAGREHAGPVRRGTWVTEDRKDWGIHSAVLIPTYGTKRPDSVRRRSTRALIGSARVTDRRPFAGGRGLTHRLRYRRDLAQQHG